MYVFKVIGLTEGASPITSFDPNHTYLGGTPQLIEFSAFHHLWGSGEGSTLETHQSHIAVGPQEHC